LPGACALPSHSFSQNESSPLRNEGKNFGESLESSVALGKDRTYGIKKPQQQKQTMNIPGKQLISQLNWRYATKQFDPARKISPEDWAALEEALVLSPSSFGLQPWKFVIVTDQAVKERLVEVSYGQRSPA